MSEQVDSVIEQSSDKRKRNCCRNQEIEKPQKLFISKESFLYLLRLFKETFKKDGAHKEEIDRVLDALYPKTWLINVLINIPRIVYPILGIAQW